MRAAAAIPWLFAIAGAARAAQASPAVIAGDAAPPPAETPNDDDDDDDAARGRWIASLEAGGEVDSNVQRLETMPNGPRAQPAPLVRVQAELARRGGSRTRWAVRGSAGARDVVAGPVRTEDLITAAIDLAIEHDGPGDDLSMVARITDYDVFPIHGVAGTRAFGSSGADLGLRLDGGDGRAATLTAGVRGLRYKPDADFNWIGGAVAIALADQVWHGADEQVLEVRAAYRLERRDYLGRAYTNGCLPAEPPSPTCFVPTALARHDLHHVLGIELTYTGERALSLSYQLVDNASSSYGSTYLRHRATASATQALPRRIYATATVIAQLDRFREPLLVARDENRESFTSIDDENRSSIALRVARALSAAWQAEARAAYYADLLPGDDRRFRRLVVYAGVTWAH